MATQAYYTWDRAGRPYRLARPVAELVTLVRAHPELTVVGTIGDTAHLTDATPEDHTPYSIDGWPVSISEYVVTAIDIGGPAQAIGEACQKALRERPPWLKYLIWRGPSGKTGLRDVRRGWVYQEGSGHTSHAHWSIRTDAVNASIGNYQLTGEDDDMPTAEEIARAVWAQRYGRTTTSMHTIVGRIEARTAAILAKVAEDDGEAAQILARVEAVAAAELERDTELRELLAQHSAGQVDAEAVVRRIGELLTAPTE